MKRENQNINELEIMITDTIKSLFILKHRQYELKKELKEITLDLEIVIDELNKKEEIVRPYKTRESINQIFVFLTFILAFYINSYIDKTYLNRVIRLNRRVLFMLIESICLVIPFISFFSNSINKYDNRKKYLEINIDILNLKKLRYSLENQQRITEKYLIDIDLGIKINQGNLNDLRNNLKKVVDLEKKKIKTLN